ncbi:MAG: hypothetical protein ACHREM_09205 [Polyangiales bacterium]
MPPHRARRPIVGEVGPVRLTFTFKFEGLFWIEVANGAGGSKNLWDMPTSIFDGQHVLRV